MNKDLLSKVLLFISGACVGSVVTWKLIEKKYQQIAQEEIDSVKEALGYFNDSETEVEPKSKDEDDEDDDDDFDYLIDCPHCDGTASWDGNFYICDQFGFRGDSSWNHYEK